MFRKIENHHFYIEILICFLLFCTISVQGQQTMTATEFLGTAYAEPIVELLQEKIKYQITTDHTLPVIKELEIRAEFDNFDWAEQEYVLRGEFNTKRQRKAQDNFHNTNVDVDNLTQQVEIKKAMTNRYEWLVKWLEVSKNIEGKTKLKSLYQDELIYLKRTVGDVGFDAQDLVKAEEEVLSISYDILKLQNRKEYLKADLAIFANGLDSVSIQREEVISNEQILQTLGFGNLDTTMHSELAKLDSRLYVLEAEKEIELSEIANPLKFAQIKVNDYEHGWIDEYVSVGLSFKLPLRGEKKLDLNEFELKKIERLGEIEILKNELETEQTTLEARIKQLIEQKIYLQIQQENSQAKYVLEQLLKLEDAKPLDILKLKEILTKRNQSIERIDFDILTEYVKWLDISDKMMESPRRNHLLITSELILNK